MKLFLKVKASASKNQVIKVNQELYHLWVTASATRGKANKVVIKLLSKHLKLKPNQIIIQKGLLSNHKIIEIT
jgi:uncharacterized protein